MPKAKKAVQPTKDNVNEEANGRSKPASNDERKPANDVKQHHFQKLPPISDMVNDALETASADGVRLISILTHIKHNYRNNQKVSTAMKEDVKEYISQEFQKGDIVAANSDEKKINFFSMRFTLPDE